MPKYLCTLFILTILTVLCGNSHSPADWVDEIEIIQEFPVEVDCLEEFIQSYYELLDSENYLNQFSFLNQNANQIHNHGEMLSAFFAKLMAIRNGYPQSVTIYQIGDSHIKPGYVSTTVRGSLLNFFLPGLSNSESSINYYFTGINGASFLNLLGNDAIFDRIKELQPDLIIISLGTNDSQGNYKAASFVKSLTNFMQKLLENQPEPTIIFTLPADCAKNGKHNTNVSKVASEIKIYAQEKGHGWWDFYEVMGGSRSIFKWNEKELASKDLIHFSPKGYMLQGQLFYHALIRAYKSQAEGGK